MLSAGIFRDMWTCGYNCVGSCSRMDSFKNHNFAYNIWKCDNINFAGIFVGFSFYDLLKIFILSLMNLNNRLSFHIAMELKVIFALLL